MKSSIWVERYRPKQLSDVIFQDDRQRRQFRTFIENGDIPNLLLSGIQGTGKTTVSRALVHELGIEPSDVLRINCSDEKIDALRNRVTAFAMTFPLGKFKVVQLEECLHKDTLVRVLRDGIEQGIKISQLNPDTDLVRSHHKKYGNVWIPFKLKNMGHRQLVKVTLSNGEVVLCTHNHKWFNANGEIVTTDKLLPGERIFSPPINRLNQTGWAGNEKSQDNTE